MTLEVLIKALALCMFVNHTILTWNMFHCITILIIYNQKPKLIVLPDITILNYKKRKKNYPLSAYAITLFYTKIYVCTKRRWVRSQRHKLMNIYTHVRIYTNTHMRSLSHTHSQLQGKHILEKYIFVFLYIFIYIYIYIFIIIGCRKSATGSE